MSGGFSSLPEDVRPYFDGAFSYGEAEGHVCSCMPGYEGEKKTT